MREKDDSEDEDKESENIKHEDEDKHKKADDEGGKTYHEKDEKQYNAERLK